MDKMNFLRRGQIAEESSSKTDAMSLSHPSVKLVVSNDKCIVTEEMIKNAELIRELMG